MVTGHVPVTSGDYNNPRTTQARTIHEHIKVDIGTTCCCCCCFCCSRFSFHNQVRGHRTGSNHSGAEKNANNKAQTNQRWYTHVSELTHVMPPPETYKMKSGVYLRCARSILVHMSHYWRQEYDFTACHPRKTTEYILHVVSYARQTEDNRKEINKEKKRRYRREKT